MSVDDKSVRVSIGDQTFEISSYQAAFIAESLRTGASGWEETAVDESRRVIKQGGGFDHLHPRPEGATYVQGFDAAIDARQIGDAHNRIAIAFYHAADDGNSHFLCDPATCQGQRDRLARIAARSAPASTGDDTIPDSFS